jgi:hypothetical protein
MKYNSDINVLGSLPDWNLIPVFLNQHINAIRSNVGLQSITAIKTDKSIRRFEKAITGTLIKFSNDNVKHLISGFLNTEQISNDSLLLIFWNASFNNNLLFYLNEKVLFPAFYSGRITIKKDEVIACLKELKETDNDLKAWSEITITTTASKYLTLLKKFGIMEGSLNKTITHPYLNDKMFVLFVYWLLAIENTPNILNSEWIKYCFLENQVFLDRVKHKKYTKFFNIIYTVNKLKIEPIYSFQDIYNVAS